MIPRPTKILTSQLLIKAGSPRVVAQVVSVLSDGKELSMREIERVADLRQPEVSIAISTLHDYVDIRERKKGNGHGRPEKIVKMCKKKLLAYVKAVGEISKEEYSVKSGAIKEIMGMVG